MMHPLMQRARASLRRAFSTTINAGALTIEPTTAPKPRTEASKLVFGKTTTDHMLDIDWTAADGWLPPRIVPYRPLSLDPACSVFHYGMSAFEGMKAYRDAAGRIRLFRPDKNMERLSSSMVRLAMPALDPAGYLACLKRLVALERSWVPDGDGFSLYLRPTVIGTQATLGVGPSASIKLFTICCPVGPYYPEGFKPVSIFAERDAVRAWPGGVGDRKLGGNYAPTILVQKRAAERGFSQVLWLVGPELAVTEVGTMNFFVLWRNRAGERELITAPLDGTILPGVTRDSILALSRGWGDFKVTEAAFTMGELADALREGRVEEAFGAGTAAVVSPVKALHFDGKDYAVPLGKGAAAGAGAGPTTQRLWKELLDIQYGRKEHPWSVVI